MNNLIQNFNNTRILAIEDLIIYQYLYGTVKRISPEALVPVVDIENEVCDLVAIYNLYNLKTEIIVASIRHSMHVVESVKAGAHVETIPFGVLEKTFKHPLTEIRLKKFIMDWDKHKANDRRI